MCASVAMDDNGLTSLSSGPELCSRESLKKTDVELLASSVSAVPTTRLGRSCTTKDVTTPMPKKKKASEMCEDEKKIAITKKVLDWFGKEHLADSPVSPNEPAMLRRAKRYSMAGHMVSSSGWAGPGDIEKKPFPGIRVHMDDESKKKVIESTVDEWTKKSPLALDSSMKNIGTAAADEKERTKKAIEQWYGKDWEQVSRKKIERSTTANSTVKAMIPKKVFYGLPLHMSPEVIQEEKKILLKHKIEEWFGEDWEKQEKKRATNANMRVPPKPFYGIPLHTADTPPLADKDKHDTTPTSTATSSPQSTTPSQQVSPATTSPASTSPLRRKKLKKSHSKDKEKTKKSTSGGADIMDVNLAALSLSPRGEDAQ